jgi:hypothetical protein
MPSRIPAHIARATASFLEMATKWDGLVFAGMLMRSGFEVGHPHGYHLVTWGTLTPQTVADALWKLREQRSEDVKAHGLTLGEVVKAWDEMILKDGEHEPV